MRFDIKPITVELSALAETRWYQYAVRFVFGGLVTAVAGIIAKKPEPICQVMQAARRGHPIRNRPPECQTLFKVLLRAGIVA